MEPTWPSTCVEDLFQSQTIESGSDSDETVVDNDNFECPFPDSILRNANSSAACLDDQFVDPREVYDALNNLKLPWVETNTCRLGRLSTRFSVNDSVELQNGDFFRIDSILHNLELDHFYFRGRHMRRNLSFAGYLDQHLNELHMEMDMSTRHASPLMQHGWKLIREDTVEKKRTVILTNARCSPLGSKRQHDFSFRDCHSPGGRNLRTSIENDGRLVCRWVYVRYFEEHRKRNSKPVEYLLRPIKQDEADQRYAISDASLFFKYRGFMPTSGKHYRAGDAFCGAGAVSEAWESLGYPLAFGIDNDPKAMMTYRLNRRVCSTHCFEHDMLDIANLGKDKLYVEVLHISPPCQPHSVVHTRPGRNDDRNEAALWAVGTALDACRPRVCTLENAFHLLEGESRRQFFQGLVNQYTTRNFGVRWKKMNFQEYGLPQARKRLIMIAACPGSSPAPFPPPTHARQGQASFLLPPVTIAQALRPIARMPSISDHDLAFAESSRRNARFQPYSPHQPLPACITCSGGESQNHHPSGRSFTVREFALLQTFSPRFKFPAALSRTTKIRQIGNAFPTVVARELFKEVIKHLRKEDQTLASNPFAQKGTIIALPDDDNISPYINISDSEN